MILSGWKEIAQYLHCGVRTAQRWEDEGLPVHRPFPGQRSHVVAQSEELDWWVRDSELRKSAETYATNSVEKARQLREQARLARMELRTRMSELKKEIASLRAKRRHNPPPPRAQ